MSTRARLLVPLLLACGGLIPRWLDDAAAKDASGRLANYHPVTIRPTESEPLGTAALLTSAAATTTILYQQSFDFGAGCAQASWMAVDLTAQTGTYFHVDDYVALNGFAPLREAKSLWCGARPIPVGPECSYLAAPGYGNNWDQAWCTKTCLTVTGDLDVAFVAMFDTEAGYDAVTLEYTEDCTGMSGWTVLDGGVGVWSGNIPAFSYAASFPVGAGPVKVRLHFQSDRAWSDEDGLWDTVGAAHFDSLVVEGLPVEDFEAEAVGATSSNDWESQWDPGFGNYMGLFPGTSLLQEDPCVRDLSCMWAAIQGSTEYYSCGGHGYQPAVPRLNSRGQYLMNEVWSPMIPLMGAGSEINLEFSVYRDLPLDNLVFYVWHVRTKGSGFDCPSPWRDHGAVYYSDTRDWFRHVENVGDLMGNPWFPGYASQVQLALGVWDLCSVWCGTLGSGECHSHAPLFDRVKLYRVEKFGPQWHIDDADQFQDSFANDGTLTGTVRADMARDILPPSSPAILAGDSAVVHVADPGEGLAIDVTNHSSAAVYCYVAVWPLGQNGKSGSGLQAPETRSSAGQIVRYPVLGVQVVNGVEWTCIQMDSVVTQGGTRRDAYCVDFKDDLFTPGDTVCFFYAARNNASQVTFTYAYGPNLTERGTDINAAAVNPAEFTCLPAGGWRRGGSILYVDGMDGSESQAAFDYAFYQMGILQQIDRYDVRAPLSRSNNRLPARVYSPTDQLLPCYRTILWDAGDLAAPFSAGTTVPGEKTADYSLLGVFLDNLLSPGGVYLCGDDVAEKLQRDYTFTSAADFIQGHIPFSLTTADHRPGYGISPLVVEVPGGCFSGYPNQFYVFGGCPVISDFDVMEPTASQTVQSVMLASYGAAAGNNGAVISCEVTNPQLADVRVILSGFGFASINGGNGGLDRSAQLHDILFCLGQLVSQPVGNERRIVFVKPTLGGAHDGTSWANAFSDLNSALTMATAGDTIWVAAGTYTPTPAGDPNATFQLRNGVSIYGGFYGSEIELYQRNWVAWPTVLSGGGSCYHVVTGSGTDATAVLDGFIVTGGSAGLSPGGGMRCDGGSPTIVNVRFVDNTSILGGGVYCLSSSPTLVNVVFSGNSSGQGGGMYNSNSSPTLVNVTFGGNSASAGGAMFNSGTSSPAIRNTVMWDDSAGSGPEIVNQSGTPIITHSVIAGCGGSGAAWNTSMGTDGGFNRDGDPLFVNLTGSDLHLSSLCSAAVEAGDNSFVPSEITTDLDGADRQVGKRVDAGAYEFQDTPALTTFRVKADALGANNGSSWADAVTDLQCALGLAVAGDSIWVAAGTYTPTSGADRTASFNLKTAVRIYGGFAGTETALDQRNWITHVTTLSGAIGSPDSTDNSYHVVTGSGVATTAVLDGFMVTRGVADGAAPHDKGAGIMIVSGSPTLGNLIFTANAAASGGGGMWNETTGSPVLTDVTFSGNSAAKGGGVYNHSSGVPTLTNVVFSRNTAALHGGAFDNDGGSPVFKNVVFFGSSASDGGAVYSLGAGTPSFINASFSGNVAANRGGGIFNVAGSNPKIVNTIMWGNDGAWEDQIGNDNATPVISHSLIANSGGSGGGWDALLGTDGGNNLDDDPLFVDSANGNLRVSVAYSPAVDAGNDAEIAGVSTDLDGNQRIIGAAVDLGPYERVPSGSVIYVDQSATGSNNGASWGNAFTDLSSALNVAAALDTIWVAVGVYKPTAGDERDASFDLKSRVAVLGGFAGTETSRSQRDWAVNETTLSGDIGAEGQIGDNSYHVIRANGTDSISVLDGFRVTGGNANGAPVNAGGGMYGSTCRSKLANLVFADNRAGAGGGVYIDISSRPTLVNVVFLGNVAASYQGGGMASVDASTPTLINVTIYGNSAPVSNGGGMYNHNNSHSTIVNTIVWGNTAAGSPEMHNDLGAVPNISYSLIGAINGAWSDGGGNVFGDPMFVDAAGGNLRLKPVSPAIDTGYNPAVAGHSRDLDARDRIVGGTVDMGAYEWDGVTAVLAPAVPKEYSLHANVPNPFNPVTAIGFELPVPGKVDLQIFDVGGRIVRRLVHGARYDAGRHQVTWDGHNDHGNGVASGVYFYRIRVNEFIATRRMVLLK